MSDEAGRGEEDRRGDASTEKYQLATMLDRAKAQIHGAHLAMNALERVPHREGSNKRYFSGTLSASATSTSTRKHPDAAMKKFEEAQKVDPGNAGAFYVKAVVLDNQAAALLQAGKNQEAQAKGAEAQAQYEKAIAIEPRHFYAQFNLGYLYWRQGKGEDALARLKAALAADPTGSDLEKTYGALAQFSAALGKDRDASDYFSRWGKIRPKPELEMSARYHMARALRSEGKVDDATKILKELSVKAPDYAPLRAELADILLEQKKWDEAIGELVTTASLLKTDEERGPIYLALGKAYREAGKPADAEAALRKALGSSMSKAEAEKELGMKPSAPPPTPPAPAPGKAK
ncbi:MAG: tetratricopeptide repeat protein [Acidobacteriota bacterium]